VVAPSYVGETCVGVCPQCRGKFEVPVPSFGNDEPGHCPNCDQLVDFEYWTGPVMVVP